MIKVFSTKLKLPKLIYLSKTYFNKKKSIDIFKHFQFHYSIMQINNYLLCLMIIILKSIKCNMLCLLFVGFVILK